MTKERFSHLYDLLQTSGFDALAVNPGPTLTYLTGLRFHISERPTILLIAPPDSLGLVLPELEISKASSSSIQIQLFPYNDNPDTWMDAYHQAFLALKLERKKIGIEPTHLRYLELKIMEAAAPLAQFVSAESLLEKLRMQKNEEEIFAMKQAVYIAQTGLHATIMQIKPGASEREIASELSLQLLRAGSDPELPFAPIVASGPNSANPHATPSDRRINRGDLLLFDWGASFHGYCSDLTRTFYLGFVEQKFLNIAEVVERANAAGRAACAPGVSPESIDNATRAVITQAGYGSYYTHRTGHGLGMEGHEPPYIREGVTEPLLPGTTFTIEPGIYLPGQGGVRIEDNILITAKGSVTLTDMPRQIQKIGD